MTLRSTFSQKKNTLENERRRNPGVHRRWMVQMMFRISIGWCLGEPAIFQGVNPPLTRGRKTWTLDQPVVWFGWFRSFWPGNSFKSPSLGKRIGKSILPNTHMMGSTSYKEGLWGPYKWVWNRWVTWGKCLVTMENGPWMKMLCVFSYLIFFSWFPSNGHHVSSHNSHRGISWRH